LIKINGWSLNRIPQWGHCFGLAILGVHRAWQTEHSTIGKIIIVIPLPVAL